MRNVIARRAMIASLGMAALLLGACETTHEPTDYTINPAATYDGPAIESSVVNGQHALMVVTPTGGWQVQGDGVRRYHMDNRIFLTMIRPNPEEMQTQALTEVALTPGVDADQPLAVYARVVAFGTNPNDTPFVFVEAIGPKN